MAAARKANKKIMKALPTKQPSTRPREMGIDDLVFKSQVYPRSSVNRDHVRHLVDVLEAGTKLPRITVQRDTRVVLNGWHRVKAYKHLGRSRIEVEEVDGGTSNAELLLFACRQDEA